MAGAAREPHAAQPEATLRFVDAVALIVGIVVGSGIFRAPSVVAAQVTGEALFLSLWLVGGLVSLAGALCYAELGSAFPSAGGEYFFLRRAYGEGVGFLFAWSRLGVMQSGAIAAVAFLFGDYASHLFAAGPHGPAFCAAVAIVLCTALNVAGSATGTWLQNVVTGGVVLTVVVVAIAGIWQSAAPGPAPLPAAAGPAPAAGVALIFVLLAYGGWNEAAYLTAEYRDARRDLVRSMVTAIGLITLLYLLVNAAYLHVLGLDGLRASHTPAADLMRVAFGRGGDIVLSLMVMVAALSTLNATMFTGARTGYALGRDYRMFGALGRWNRRANAPVAGLVAQCAMALLLVAVAAGTRDGFETLVAYTAGAFWLFFLLTGAALFVLRLREPLAPRPFRVPLYPVTPLVFCSACAYMLWACVRYATSLGPASGGAWLGLGVLLLGVPAFLAARRGRR